MPRPKPTAEQKAVQEQRKKDYDLHYWLRPEVKERDALRKKEERKRDPEKLEAGYVAPDVPTTNTLQLLIEKRALKRLEEDFYQIRQKFRSEKLFKHKELIIQRRKVSKGIPTDWGQTIVEPFADFLETEAVRK